MENLDKKGQTEEVKPYMLNRDLQFTPLCEIKRLRKVIEEKDALIAKFKKYDEERKSYYRRFEQNYQMMEEKFGDFLEAINECDDIDACSKDFYKEVVMRLYKGKVMKDKEKSILQIAHSHLMKLQDAMVNMEFVIMTVGNVKKKSELLDEFRKLKVRITNMTSSFNQRMKELK